MKVNIGELLVGGWLLIASCLTIAKGAPKVAGPTTEISPLKWYDYDSVVCAPFAVAKRLGGTDKYCKQACAKLEYVYPDLIVAGSGTCTKPDGKKVYVCHCSMMEDGEHNAVDVKTPQATHTDVLLNEAYAKSKRANQKKEELAKRALEEAAQRKAQEVEEQMAHIRDETKRLERLAETVQEGQKALAKEKANQNAEKNRHENELNAIIARKIAAEKEMKAKLEEHTRKLEAFLREKGQTEAMHRDKETAHGKQEQQLTRLAAELEEKRKADEAHLARKLEEINAQLTAKEEENARILNTFFESIKTSVRTVSKIAAK